MPIKLWDCVTLTRKANHPILLAHRPNNLLPIRFPKIPRILILARDLRELGIQLGILLMIRLQALAPVRPKAVLVQRVNVDGSADFVDGAEVWRGVSMVRELEPER
jgi:hypothetical protein